MKTYLSILLLFLLVSSCGTLTDDDRELQELYALLDTEINNSKVYEAAKERRIANLRKVYFSAADSRSRTEIINKLIGELDAYNADSALYYIGYHLHSRDIMATPHEYTRMLIKRADVFAHAGLFPDALETMSDIRRDSLTSDLMEAYYSTYCAIYQYLSEYTYEHEYSSTYEERRSIYADSLSKVISPGSFNYLVYVLTEQARNGEPQKAIETLSQQLEKYDKGTREYSILASILAYTYKTGGQQEEYKRYLTLSAISDTRGAVKENMSFRELAAVMFEDGDIDRANRYLGKSIADANFYSAFMRNVQSGKILPVIDEAYSSMQLRLTRRLSCMVWFTSILSVILIISILFILRQFKSLRRANGRICRVNDKLKEVSGQLQDANADLQGKNKELRELSEVLRQAITELDLKNKELRDNNRTKEQYAGLFMTYCSSAISTLQHYQQSLRILAAQGGNRVMLVKKLESSDIADRLLKIFYMKFDEAILNIYPSFADKFNQLLRPDGQVILKPGEFLNTELRLFALIRIGIDDSAKIAEFLRCSISTVYTYRSKMRRRAVNPDTFEDDVKNIG